MERDRTVLEIDWEKQWAQFAPGFHEGCAHIDLTSYGSQAVIRLKPGAGFGDFSHPTTRLALGLMAPLVKNKVVFDIGSGSGILSLAAVFLGARNAYGIDIEEQAVLHARENAEFNHLQDQAVFAKTVQAQWIPKDPCVVTMNMIESEQHVAWNSIRPYMPKNFIAITSGILSVDADRYLQVTKSWGWVLKEKKVESDWSGFIFNQK